jgi:acetyl/propionyl-CoA carboxylase alpha subunit
MPRIRLAASCPRPGRCTSFGSRVARTFVSTRASRKDRKSRPITIRCWPRSSLTRRHASEAHDRLSNALEQKRRGWPAHQSRIPSRASWRTGRAKWHDRYRLDRSRDRRISRSRRRAIMRRSARAVEELLRRQRERLAGRAARRTNERRSPWDATDAFGFVGERETIVAIRIDGDPAKALVRYGSTGARVSIEGTAAQDCELIDAAGGLLAIRGDTASLVELDGSSQFDPDQLTGDGIVVAPMHGKVLAIDVATGDVVAKGQRLAVIEAMKMEHALHAHGDGDRRRRAGRSRNSGRGRRAASRD